MKQLSLMSVLRSSTLVCFVLFGPYQSALALRQSTSTSSLYGALSSGTIEEPALNFKSVHTLIDTPESVEVLSTQNSNEPTEKTVLPDIDTKKPFPLKKESLVTAPAEEQSLQTIAPTIFNVQQADKVPQEAASTPSALLIPGAPVVTMPAHNDKDELVEFQFEGTDLDNLVKQVALLYDVIFIPDDTISPLPQDSKSLKGNKVSFKTHRAMTKGQAWDIFITFLHLSGFALTPDGHAHTYRITTLKNAQRNPLPTYINVDYKDLPDSDVLIRYVYFIENAATETIKGLLENFRSPDSLVQVLNDAKAFVITDRAYNIKVLINIIKELDKASMPQELLVMKLRQVDAQHVKDLYESLVQSEDKSGYQRFFPPRKSPTSLYFPENVRMIAEKRTNTLIILGPKDALKVLENFIVKNIDVSLDQPYSKLTTHQLKYADAKAIQDIMNTVTKFGSTTDVGKAGGVRGSDKFFKPIEFVAEPDTNKLIIKGDYEDYLLIKPTIEQLDVPQPQVAIEVLLLAVESRNLKEFGSQIRTKDPAFGLMGNNVKFQKAGLNSKIYTSGDETKGANRLLGDLIGLVTGDAFGGPGKTVLTLGSDKYGVWGIFRALEQVTDSQVISNPFITTSNKTPATISLGETRRVVASKVISSDGIESPSYKDEPANLSVEITPQINSDGMISLKISIKFQEFTTPASNTENSTRVTRNIQTNAVIANKEILAIGGLLQDKSIDKMATVPGIGQIPLLGWLFKDKSKEDSKNTLLVLISTQIINPLSTQDNNMLKKSHTDKLIELTKSIDSQFSTKDPIDKTFFDGRSQDPTEKYFNDYIEQKFGVKQYETFAKKVKKKPSVAKKERISKKKRKKVVLKQPSQEVVA